MSDLLESMRPRVCTGKLKLTERTFEDLISRTTNPNLVGANPIEGSCSHPPSSPAVAPPSRGRKSIYGSVCWIFFHQVGFIMCLDFWFYGTRVKRRANMVSIECTPSFRKKQRKTININNTREAGLLRRLCNMWNALKKKI